ncbi:hypothetical protein, partial [Candidatus Chloroploca sp. Khr17]|uniref:hypothetical protein n=1 Tax=Candidatus Chloroploca sp. Khr17 TaxID=2496869 RepID=UPI00196ADD8A
MKQLTFAVIFALILPFTILLSGSMRLVVADGPSDDVMMLLTKDCELPSSTPTCELPSSTPTCELPSSTPTCELPSST